MVANIRKWWLAHSVGERALLAVLGFAILVVLLWLGVWRPVNAGLEAGWARQGAALDRRASVRARVDAIKAAPAGTADSSAGLPIDQLVSQTAAEAGFTLDRGAAQGGGRMTVAISSARMGPLLAWLTRLETAGIRIQTIGITPGATEGTVAMQAVLEESRP
jgi:general secretion pathway protein M